MSFPIEEEEEIGDKPTKACQCKMKDCSHCRIYREAFQHGHLAHCLKACFNNFLYLSHHLHISSTPSRAFKSYRLGSAKISSATIMSPAPRH
jgi:hypothetical protein